MISIFSEVYLFPMFDDFCDSFHTLPIRCMDKSFSVFNNTIEILKSFAGVHGYTRLPSCAINCALLTAGVILPPIPAYFYPAAEPDHFSFRPCGFPITTSLPDNT